MNDWKNPLHGDILAGLKARTEWEKKQNTFFRMRHNGRARQKRESWQSDLHWPLIDTNIEKLKPLFFQQIVGMDTVASFVPMRSQTTGITTSAEQWFDYKIRERTNLQDEALAWIDYALMSGRGVIKVYWDQRKKAVHFDAIDPLYFIVPPHTKELQDADWLVHVMPMSKAAYERKAAAMGWKADKATIERLLASDDAANESSGQVEQSSNKRTREGITHDTKAEKVIVWEVYEKQADGKWIVKTYSPVDPDLALREPFEVPYGDGTVAPFVDFAYEVKDKGWYSPRGIAELLAPFEAALCHTWNQKHDAMTLFNKPIFRAERDVGNTGNLRLNPGSILPVGVVPAQQANPPISFDQEMTNVRQVAEQRVANPDYGMGQVINTRDRRTATEIEAIAAQSAQSGDLRARLFRIALAKLYRQAWTILSTYDKQDLVYRFLDDVQQADGQGIHGEYTIEPKGGVNEVNRQFLLQKAIQRKQLLGQSPWINQPELDRTIIELDDPSLVKRLFVDPNLKGQEEAADEAKGIPALMLGANLPVTQGMDYKGRLGVLIQYLAAAQSGQSPMTPQGGPAIFNRVEALLQAYEQVDANDARQIRAAFAKDFMQTQQPPQVPQPQAMPGGV